MIDSDSLMLGVWWGLSLFAVWEISGGYHYKKAMHRANQAVENFMRKINSANVTK